MLNPKKAEKEEKGTKTTLSFPWTPPDPGTSSGVSAPTPAF